MEWLFQGLTKQSASQSWVDRFAFQRQHADDRVQRVFYGGKDEASFSIEALDDFGHDFAAPRLAHYKINERLIAGNTPDFIEDGKILTRYKQTGNKSLRSKLVQSRIESSRDRLTSFRSFIANGLWYGNLK